MRESCFELFITLIHSSILAMATKCASPNCSNCLQDGAEDGDCCSDFCRSFAGLALTPFDGAMRQVTINELENVEKRKEQQRNDQIESYVKRLKSRQPEDLEFYSTFFNNVLNAHLDLIRRGLEDVTTAERVTPEVVVDEASRINASTYWQAAVNELRELQKYGEWLKKKPSPRPQLSADIAKKHPKRSLRRALRSLRKLEGVGEVKQWILDILITARRDPVGFISQKRNIALKGPPGTGKTSSAQIFFDVLYGIGANSLPVNVKAVTATRVDFVAGFENQSAILTRKQLLGSIGKVKFIDEAYTLFNSNGKDDDSAGREVLAAMIEFQSRLEGANTLIFAGYTDEMNKMLRVNPGLKRRLGTPPQIVLQPWSFDMIYKLFADENRKYKFALWAGITDSLFMSHIAQMLQAPPLPIEEEEEEEEEEDAMNLEAATGTQPKKKKKANKNVLATLQDKHNGTSAQLFRQIFIRIVYREEDLEFDGGLTGDALREHRITIYKELFFYFTRDVLERMEAFELDATDFPRNGFLVDEPLSNTAIIARWPASSLNRVGVGSDDRSSDEEGKLNSTDDLEIYTSGESAAASQKQQSSSSSQEMQMVPARPAKKKFAPRVAPLVLEPPPPERNGPPLALNRAEQAAKQAAEPVDDIESDDIYSEEPARKKMRPSPANKKRARPQ